MVLAKDEPKADEYYSNSANKQLLRDIEAISRALYLPKITQKALLLSPTDIQSGSSQDVHLMENRSIQRSKNNNDHVMNKGKKSSSSLWNWKKPLKVISHIWYRKFSCSFFLHVHSIEGLPPNFNDMSLCVEFRRKDEVLKTKPSRVSKGTADFDETLMHSCTIYCHKTGMQDSCKYEPKIFLLYASIAGAVGVDIGKHWIDLTRLLPLTFEDLEGQKSSGKWTTSFELAGKAKGATLTVSFGFSLVANAPSEPSGNMTVSELINLAYGRRSIRESGIQAGQNDTGGKLPCSSSVPSNLNNGSLLSNRSYEAKTHHQVSVNPILELSKSINLLSEKLDEGNLNSSSSSQPVPKNMMPLSQKSNFNLEPVGSSIVDESDDMDFVVIDRGVEVLEKGEKNLVQDCINTRDGTLIETINIDEIHVDDDGAHEKRIACESVEVGTHEKENPRDEIINEVHGTCMSTMEGQDSAFENLLFLESTELDPSLATGNGSRLEVRTNYEATKTLRRSLSLDNFSESMASDFLNMLADEHGSNELDSNSEPESPRERLLREFEKEALVSGNFILDFDTTEELVGSFCGASSVSDSIDGSDDFFHASVLHDAEEESQRGSLYMRRRRKAKMIEDIETGALMREWGLDEKAFLSAPRFCSTGFGSPIELPPEDSVELPLLGEGFGPSIQTKGGGLLRTMSPLLFRNAKIDVSLVMQVTAAVVLQAELGSTNAEVLSHLVLLGVENLSMQMDKIMPMEDITGRTLHHIASEVVDACCNAAPQCETTNEEDFFGRRWELEENAFGGSCKDFKIDLDSVSLSDILLLAIDKVEALSIEGLRIQSGMSNEEAPSNIYPGPNVSPFEGKITDFLDLTREQVTAFQVHNTREAGTNADDLIGLSISLDEWLKLDAGSGALGSELTVAFRLQLRDPLRNYEAVGDPMLVLVHVERDFVPSAASRRRINMENNNLSALNERADMKNEEMKSEKEKLISYFRITEVHLAGVDTYLGRNSVGVTSKQKQLGTRWLLASGLGKGNAHPLSESRTLVKWSPLVQTYTRSRNILWSISSCRADLEEQISYLRNPNIIFPDESIS